MQRHDDPTHIATIAVPSGCILVVCKPKIFAGGFHTGTEDATYEEGTNARVELPWDKYEILHDGEHVIVERFLSETKRGIRVQNVRITNVDGKAVEKALEIEGLELEWDY
ncbi:MAG: hypothetical protein Q7T01_03110 [bacterium]|nr:hypothetical protein [bacterium]